MAYLLGIDVSTTATKAIIIDEAGAVVSVSASPHELHTPHPLWSEQDPEEWWKETGESIRRAIELAGISGSEIVSVGLTGQMHGLVLLDSNGAVLRPAILWNDGRSNKECDLIRSRVGFDRLVSITGNDAFAGFTAPKILWMRENEPDLYAQAAQVLLPKDYVRFRLTGEYATDKEGAAGTLLMDLETRDWSQEILDTLEIPRSWLPRTFEGTEVTGLITEQAAEATGLSVGTPVVAGAGDQAAQAVGVGAVRPGVVALTLGTSGVVFAPTDRPVIAPEGRAHSFPHAMSGIWHLMGVMLSAGGSLRWYHDTFAPDTSFDELVAEAAEAPIGSDGVLFMPYLTGERTPHANPHATGVIFGLTLRHQRKHITRAVLEGVAFGIKDNFTLLREAGVPEPSEVRVSGGGTKSTVWRQILADVLDVPLVAPKNTEGAAFGAALLAGVGVETWKNVDEACSRTIVCEPVAQPDSEGVSAYRPVYERFRSLYPQMEPLFRGGDA